MKTTLLALLICFAVISADAMNFTIKGNIEGLMPGDTLTFERISLPNFDLEFAFDVIVEKQDEFIYAGGHKHIGYYMMSYKSISNKVNYSDRRGLTILIKDGIITLNGTADQIYYCQLEGELYDNETFQEALQLETLLGKDRGSISRLIGESRAAGDTVKLLEYIDMFNFFHEERKEEFKKLSLLKSKYYDKYPSSEHTIIDVLQKINSVPYETTRDRYEKMSHEAKISYFGTILKQELDKIAVLQPGNKAPDFHLTAINGNEISLKDYAGSYLLIYHWGLCPGSLMINNDVIELHNNYKNHLKIIGITNRIEDIKSWYDNTAPDSKFMHLDLKPILANMLSHPWLDVEKTGDNDIIEKVFAFGGLPFFVFICPDGKIIARDFHEAFFIAKETMKAEFGN